MSKNIHAMIAALGTAGVLASVHIARADEVTHWVGVFNQAVRVNGGGPCPLSRGEAMTFGAVYEAVNSIDRRHRPYISFLGANAGCSKEAAVAQAAHDVLVNIYPAQQAYFDAQLAARLALIPNGLSKTEGVGLGAAAAVQMITHRFGDGSGNNAPYAFGGNPGDFVMPEDFTGGSQPHAPNWGFVRPFAMSTSSLFRLPGPGGFTSMSSLLASSAYTAQLNEVKDVGERNSATRTRDQTELAFFWANDVDATYKPPGHLLNIAVEISTARGLDLVQNARLFGLLTLAHADSGIVAWDMKYDTSIDLWRPISGIRRADTDGNPDTIADPAWLPLNTFTPPFPAWTSGHSTFGGATAGVLAEFFGTDNMTFSITSEDPFYAALVPAPSPTRTFTSFSQMGFEDAISRVYLGVHWRWDCTDGFATGSALGHHVGQNYLLPRCGADMDDGTGTGYPDGGVTIDDLLYFLAEFELGAADADMDDGSLTGTRDGGVTVDDLLFYLHHFEVGC